MTFQRRPVIRSPYHREPTYGCLSDKGASVDVLGAVAWLARPGDPLRYFGDTHYLEEAMEDTRAES